MQTILLSEIKKAYGLSEHVLDSESLDRLLSDFYQVYSNLAPNNPLPNVVLDTLPIDGYSKNEGIIQ